MLSEYGWLSTITTRWYLAYNFSESIVKVFPLFHSRECPKPKFVTNPQLYFTWNELSGVSEWVALFCKAPYKNKDKIQVLIYSCGPIKCGSISKIVSHCEENNSYAIICPSLIFLLTNRKLFSQGWIAYG